jgi:hypothetical protein
MAVWCVFVGLCAAACDYQITNGQVVYIEENLKKKEVCWIRADEDGVGLSLILNQVGKSNAKFRHHLWGDVNAEDESLVEYLEVVSLGGVDFGEGRIGSLEVTAKGSDTVSIGAAVFPDECRNATRVFSNHPDDSLVLDPIMIKPVCYFNAYADKRKYQFDANVAGKVYSFSSPDGPVVVEPEYLRDRILETSADILLFPAVNRSAAATISITFPEKKSTSGQLRASVSTRYGVRFLDMTVNETSELSKGGLIMSVIFIVILVGAVVAVIVAFVCFSCSKRPMIGEHLLFEGRTEMNLDTGVVPVDGAGETVQSELLPAP